MSLRPVPPAVDRIDCCNLAETDMSSTKINISLFRSNKLLRNEKDEIKFDENNRKLD